MPTHPPRPADPAAHLIQFIEHDTVPTGSGPYSLADFCEQLRIAWDRRHDPGVHLLRYADLCDDLDGQMRRLAAILGVEIDEDRWPDLVAAARFDAMRDRAGLLAPYAHLGIWRSDEAFFVQGGPRDWQRLLTADQQAAFRSRFEDLAGPAADWLLTGS